MPFINLIFTSGALQYTPNPYILLEEIVESNAQYLLFSRLNLVKDSHDVITIQKSMLSWNGIGPLPKGFRDRIVSYPITAMQKNKFDSIIQKKYVYEVELEDSFGVVPVNKEPIVGGGVLCRLKSN